MKKLVGLVALLGVFLTSCADLKVEIPEYEAPGKIVRLDQGWNAQEWLEFHHTPQGTQLLPYQWFMALEQPCLSLFECDPLHDDAYLSRFGFLSSIKDEKLNPDGLPVGFAAQQDFTDPLTGKSFPVVGLTCAACHTGELRYDGYAVRIEGGPAMIELAQFQKAVGLAVGLTEKVPGRFGRFADRVLGEDASEEARDALEKAFGEVLADGLARNAALKEQKAEGVAAGFIRTDALARIGNEVFGFDMKINGNLVPPDAPVRFPQIWDSSWLTWVQYNSSISDPLVRNIGESLGVRASAKLYGPDAGEFKNSVYLDGLRTVEHLLAGNEPFGGLTSPKWPEVFPTIDEGKRARGAELYEEHCEKCHLPSIEELKVDLASEEPKYWWENSLGLRLLIVRDIKVDFMGTDPRQAMNFINRKADAGDLAPGQLSAADGLKVVTEGIALRFFEERSIPPRTTARMARHARSEGSADSR